jgi:hypothetical protein
MQSCWSVSSATSSLCEGQQLDSQRRHLVLSALNERRLQLHYDLPERLETSLHVSNALAPAIATEAPSFEGTQQTLR